ncbi:Signal transduction histidine kinase [Catalinimonas alkaloidigena]|uniref:histidine kinase n=1 Tax=Catalinimonas alkaloidigena TaxID=1075417 RepID=A0A1G8XIR0_9BACT|nr:two-component regulator propeller domain-containing protein [Catalinimonas alkaloidigena]SDJ89775.1 Signal transduction histidine kinase [Catalinimonas alkaloidigena]
MKRLLCFALLLVDALGTTLCAAPHPEATSPAPATYNLYHLGTDEGLPSDNIEYVFQDSYGFLWASSYDGLIRWDGQTFVTYAHDEADSTSLSHNIINCIWEDSQRRLWIGTNNGLNRYDRTRDQFQKCALGRPEENIPVNVIREDGQHRLWVGTSLGLCQYTPETNASRWFHYEPDNPNSLSHDVIFGMAIDAQDRLWLGTFNGGVTRFAPRTGTFVRLTHEADDPQRLSSNKIRSVYIDGPGRVWVGTFDRGITLLNQDGDVLRQYPRFSDEAGTGQDMISSLYEDHTGQLWVGVSNANAYFLDDQGNFQPFTNPAYKKPEVQARTVTSFCEDSFGNLWFATRGQGLFYTNPGKNVFRSYAQHKGPGGLNHPVVSSFLEDDRGTIWVGTDGGGLSRFEPQTQRFSHVTTQQGLSSNAVMDLKQDRNGQLWVATWSGGLVQFDPATRRAQVFMHDPADPHSLPYNNLKAVLPDDSLLWIGTHGEGLAVLDLRTHEIIHHRNNDRFPFDLRAPAWINHLYKDTKGRLWISTYSGLFVIEGPQMRHYAHRQDTTTISSNGVNMVAEDGLGQLWVVSESGGLDRYDEAADRFVRYSERYHLPHTLKALATDHQGQLWLSSNVGLIAFDPQAGTSVHYDVSDGLQGNSFFLKSVLKSRTGELYFGGTNGFNVFAPQQVQPPRFDAPFYLSDLYLFDQRQAPGADGSPLARELAFTDTLTLTHRQSFFTLAFAAINLYAPHKMQYRYKLEGLHDQWVNLHHEHRASFTNLDPGTYRFRVRYSDDGQHWQEASSPLHIVVLPPWWKTWWFRALVALALLSLIGLLFYLRVRSIKAHNRELREEVARQTHELLDANAALQESSEEVRQQNERLEEYNVEITRKTNKILHQQEQIVEQNQELEKTVNALADLNRTKDRFFSILAHDLKNPVYALLGNLAVLRQQARREQPHALHASVEHLHHSSRAISQLLDNLLDWSRTQSKNMAFAPVALSVRELLWRNETLVAPLCAQKELTLQIDVPTERYVWADAYMLDAIVRNLLSNAIKFTPRGGRIDVQARLEGEEVVLTVQDTGVGMTEAQRRNLFRIDHKSHTPGTEGETGTSLGLIITREFLHLNRGTIDVESTPGQGTTFRVRLPQAQDVSRPHVAADLKQLPSRALDWSVTTASESAPPPVWAVPEKLQLLKGRRVLIVDDDPALRAHLRALLSGIFEIFEAENGRQAIERAQEHQPAAIVSDMLMPVLDGLQFCRAIKQNPATCHIPVILLTSQREEESQLSGYEAGADAYLTKPLHQEMLVQLIYNCIQTQEKVRQKFLLSDEIHPDELLENKLDADFMETMVRYIEAHLQEPELNADALCDVTALSRSVLYAKCKTLTGQGVHEFIKSIRLKKSVRLLVEDRLSVSQIAYEVGFNSPSYYIRCFNKQYGVSPKEYLKRLRSEVSGSPEVP